MTLYFVPNGPMATTAAPAPVTTGTAIKTMLQIATTSTQKLMIVEWGISFDGAAAATPIRCELVETGAVAATVTAHVAAGVQPYRDSGAPASSVTLSTTGTGYTATVEGAVVATRHADLQFIAPTNQYVKQWPLGREFDVGVSRFLRVRVTAAAAVNCYTYVIYEQ